MRKLNRLTMTLALLIMAVGGAWAQSSPNVVELEVPADWEGEYSPLTAADLPGFYTSTKEEAQAWTGAPAEGTAMLIYAFDDDDNAYHVPFVDGTAKSPEDYAMSKALVFEKKTKIYYTIEPTEWSLTPDKTGKSWTLDKMPASDIELQVEYFAESNLFLSKEAQADEGSIAVKAGETTVEFGDDGKSANTVTEGSAMTVTYNGTKKLLGMKVAKKAAPKTFNCDGTVLVYEDGDTWADVIARNPDKISQNGNLISHVGEMDCLQIGEYFVYPDHKVDPNANYKWEDG